MSSFSALPLFVAALLALACCLSAASATESPATHSGFSSDASTAAISANDLSGVWSATDASGATYSVKFVQQGNQLILPLVNRPLPTGLNATIYGGYGTGYAALWRNNNPNIFCFYVRAPPSAMTTTTTYVNVLILL
jgi:hypothetical protein